VSNYIYDKVGKLIKKYHTRNPFDILEQMNVVVKESSNYHNLKGYCLVSCKTTYVVINSQLSEPEKRIVAAHELGHVVLHRSLMKLAPMMDSTIYDMVSKTEYEANLLLRIFCCLIQTLRRCHRTKTWITSRCARASMSVRSWSVLSCSALRNGDMLITCRLI